MKGGYNESDCRVRGWENERNWSGGNGAKRGTERDGIMGTKLELGGDIMRETVE